jgi:hypothetical protein
MSLLFNFMSDLLMHYEGEIEIVVDNARMTTNQKAVPLPLTRDSLHSNLHSSNHSTTRWEMNDSSHSTGPGASCSSVSAPTRKPSTDHVARVSRKPKNGKKEKGKSKTKSRKTKKAPASPSTGMPPRSPIYKKKALVSCMKNPDPDPIYISKEQKPMKQKPKRHTNISKSLNQPGSSLVLVKPSRQLSLGVADVHPQAPKLPTRRPSTHPDMYSPAAPSTCSTKSIQAYTKIMDDIALSPTDRSSMSLERSISAVIAPPFLFSPKQKPMKQKYKRHTNIFKSLNQPGSSVVVVKPSRQLSPILNCEPAVILLKTYLKTQGRSLSKTLGVADVHPKAPKMPTRRPSAQPDMYSPAASSPCSTKSIQAYTKIMDDISLSPTDRSSMSPESFISPVIAPPFLASPKRRIFPKPSGKWRRPLTKRS